ncbi:MAG: DUF4416 family protein [Candidatus Omnitrophica bacterium]|nr:DUF4416 family protein [Candidatus Omnitrophota bacterium]
MFKKQLPKKVKCICAFIYKDEAIFRKVKNIMAGGLGTIDYESKPIKFDFTDYYEKEMGAGLSRRFVSFKKLMNPLKLLKVKLDCIKLEKKFSCQDKRRINIDPGYLNEARLILLSTKDFYHRIYLGKCIYAEVTLYYAQRDFRDLPWTFPDYRTPGYKNIFIEIRDNYIRQIRDKK